MTVPDATVVVMAKAPIPGRVKTRLFPRLGAAGAARLQAALITHTVNWAAAVAPTFVAVDPPEALDSVRMLVPERVELFAQTDGALGARMKTAVDAVAARTATAVIVIGADAPTLGPHAISETARLLRSGADVVIGPAHDGGYYLIALACPIPEVFAIDARLWGGPRVLAETLAALDSAGRSVRLLEPLRDLDTPADADAFVADPKLPAVIAELLIKPGVAA